MADEDISREDRQLPASERKLSKAREDGQVARSRDFGHIALLAMTFGTFAMMAGSMGRQAVELMQIGLNFRMNPHQSPELIFGELGAIIAKGGMIILPIGLVGLLAGIIAAVIPGGLAWSSKPVRPTWSKISPMSGIKRLLSRGHIIDSLKLTAIIGLLAVVGGLYLWINVDRFLNLMRMPLPSALTDAWDSVLPGAGAMLMLIALAAAIDMPMQWFRHRADLRMTREEARKEQKESEGDPHLKSRLRARQREISMARMIMAVPRADVVITNPTHYSVALVYQGDGSSAPRVVAKGADLIALRIREVAREHGVPLFEAPPLARALYAHVPLDQEIPGALYSAVAQVLAYIYALRQPVRRGAAPLRAPAVDDLSVPADLDPDNEPVGGTA